MALLFWRLWKYTDNILFVVGILIGLVAEVAFIMEGHTRGRECSDKVSAGLKPDP